MKITLFFVLFLMSFENNFYCNNVVRRRERVYRAAFSTFNELSFETFSFTIIILRDGSFVNLEFQL